MELGGVGTYLFSIDCQSTRILRLCGSELIYFVDVKLQLQHFIEQSSLVKRKFRHTTKRLNTSEPRGFGLSGEAESCLLLSEGEGPGMLHCQPATRTWFHSECCGVGDNQSSGLF